METETNEPAVAEPVEIDEPAKTETLLDKLKREHAAKQAAGRAAEIASDRAQFDFEKTGVVLSDGDDDDNTEQPADNKPRFGQKRVVGLRHGVYYPVDQIDPGGEIERHFLEVYQSTDLFPEGEWVRIDGEGWATRDEAAKFL